MVADGASFHKALCLVLIGFHASPVIASVSYGFGYGMIYGIRKFGHKQTDPDQGQGFMQQNYAFFASAC